MPERIEIWDIWSVMTFPNDFVRAELCKTYLRIQHGSKINKLPRIFSENLSKLGLQIHEDIKDSFHAIQEVVELEVNKAMQGVSLNTTSELLADGDFLKTIQQAENQGFLAGRFLLRILQMVNTGFEPIVGHAEALVSEEFDYFSVELGKDAPHPTARGKRTIEKSRKKFRRVAHWWGAAWLMWRESYEQKKQTPSAKKNVELPLLQSINPRGETGLPYLVSTSQSLFDQASAIILGQKGGMETKLLDPYSAWGPKDESWDTPSLEIPKLEGWAQEFLLQQKKWKTS